MSEWGEWFHVWRLDMPMKSKAQRRYLHAKHPEVAEEFERATPKGKKLPEHVKKRSKKR